MDRDNRILARHYRRLRDDVSALDLARRLSSKTGCEAEVWEGPRFVARLKHDGTASFQVTPPEQRGAFNNLGALKMPPGQR